jgi:hypothetical protein
MLLCDCPVIVDFTEAESRAKHLSSAYWDPTPSASFARSAFAQLSITVLGTQLIA